MKWLFFLFYFFSIFVEENRRKLGVTNFIYNYWVVLISALKIMVNNSVGE